METEQSSEICQAVMGDQFRRVARRRREGVDEKVVSGVASEQNRKKSHNQLFHYQPSAKPLKIVLRAGPKAQKAGKKGRENARVRAPTGLCGKRAVSGQDGLAIDGPIVLFS